MPVTPSVDDIILLIVEIPCYLYHVSVAYLIIWHIVHRVSPFTNAFFVLFALICCADLGYFLFCSVMNIKLAQLGLFTDFFVSPSGGWVSTIGYMSGEYFGIFQALTHMVITINRFNVFYFSAYYDKIWQGRRLVAVVIFLIISPVCFFAWHLNHRILYYMVDENTIAQMMDDLHVQLIVSTMGFILFVITTGINVVLGAVTAFRYRQLTRQVQAQGYRQNFFGPSAQGTVLSIHDSDVIALFTPRHYVKQGAGPTSRFPHSSPRQKVLSASLAF
uniref:Serpentine receptor class gamma n=1 Tax=Panagrellus redivivus TaxID=6233 RepID=A0A7E4VG42_PANRE